MKALCLIRDALHYRRDAFCAGLAAAGYSVVRDLPNPSPEDILIIWNRYGRFDAEAKRFELAGARVLVAENGYLGKGWRGGDWYALALGHHGGAGRWKYGGSDRWDKFGVELSPWRVGGDEIIILGQRGIGEPGLASPDGWAEKMKWRFHDSRIRPHPGKNGGPDLMYDLEKARAVVTWSSGAALSALIYGIPVWCANKWWIGASAAAHIDQCLMRDDIARLETFRRLAWAQWNIDEIRTGEAIIHALN